MIFTHNQKETSHQNTARITQSLSNMMERTGQKYEKLLHVAGGDLNLPKGHCYILTWHWDKKGIPSMNTISNTPIDMNMTHSRDETKEKSHERKHQTHAKPWAATQPQTEATKANTTHSCQKQ
jgi:hypothetical protein